MLNSTKDFKNSFSMCSCCSSCSKWDSCETVDSPTDKLVRDCFVGKKLRLSVEFVEYYASCNPVLSHFRDAGFIWLGAKYKSGNLFTLYMLSNFKQDGFVYICDVCTYQANYSCSTNRVNIYINGCDFSMSPSRFAQVFGVTIPTSLLQRKVGGLWTFKRPVASEKPAAVSHSTKSFGFREC
jgi:hypothetical protein